MLRFAPARFPSAWSLLRLLLLPCAYLVVGTWAFTTELARQSLPREVSATADPARALKALRPTTARADRRAQDLDARQDHGWHELDGRPAPVSGWLIGEFYHVSGGITTARACVPAHPGNCAPYDATAPPVGR